VIFMVEGTSFMGLGGPNLVKGATGQVVDAETLGGASMHTAKSAVAHYRAATDAECLKMVRGYLARLPARRGAESSGHRPAEPPSRPVADLYDILPADHRMSYDMHALLSCLLDRGELHEFQPDIARELLCGHARIEGHPVAVLANARAVIKGPAGQMPRIGGIIYTESAEKAAYFIETANRERMPLLFVQDVSGFMVGPEAEQSGIIRAGAEFVEAMATAVVPKIVLTLNHASGAGYYAMAGQGFDPDFIVSWPTGRMGVMEGDSAVAAVYGTEIERLKKEKRELSPETLAAMAAMRADYETQLDACHAAARGHVDAIVTPEETRDQLAFLLRVSSNYAGPHLGPFVLPTLP
jgi:acetyl-CoA carboxylase carboxyltransferase component